MIQLPQDIFKLDYDKIEKLEGWGRLSVENLKYSINQKKNISLERLIYSLGIRHIGLENAKLLSKHFISFSKFKGMCGSSFSNISLGYSPLNKASKTIYYGCHPADLLQLHWQRHCSQVERLSDLERYLILTVLPYALRQ